MTPQDITDTLIDLFGSDVQVGAPEVWQVEINELRLLVLLSNDQSWLRSLVTIAPAQEADAYLPQLLGANFDETQETRYALYEGTLWGVFQHKLSSLTVEDFREALARLRSLQQKGLADSFNQLAETQIRQIIRVAKLQGQSLEATLQTLQRFYAEGVMGGIEANAEEQQQALDAWRYQLERLWEEE